MYISCAGLRAKDIDILVVNCSLFNPTPSLSAMIVNHFKMRSNVLSYNLAGVFCNSASLHICLGRSSCPDSKEEQHHYAHAQRSYNPKEHGILIGQSSKQCPDGSARCAFITRGSLSLPEHANSLVFAKACSHSSSSASHKYLAVFMHTATRPSNLPILL